jgi:hypothetical protein
MSPGRELRAVLVTTLSGELEDESDWLKSGYASTTIDENGRLTAKLSAAEVDELYDHLLSSSVQKPTVEMFGVAHLLACALIGGRAAWIDVTRIATSIAFHANSLPYDVRLMTAIVLHEDSRTSNELERAFSLSGIVIVGAVLCDLVAEARDRGTASSDGSPEGAQWGSVIRMSIGGPGGLESALKILRSLK